MFNWFYNIYNKILTALFNIFLRLLRLLNYKKSSDKINIYFSGQWTSLMELCFDNYQYQINKLYFSSPHFNKNPSFKNNINIIPINVPVYGKIVETVYELFYNNIELLDHLNKNKIVLPPIKLERTFQSHINKIKVVTKKLEYYNHHDASINISNFLSDFEKLSDNITITEWQAFIKNYNITSINYDNLLQNFDPSITKETSDMIRQIPVKKEDGSITNLEFYAFRPLGKLMSAFKPLGCYVDIVTLIFILMNKKYHKNIDEDEIIEIINKFNEIIINKNFEYLHIIDYLVHDAENDDMLSWGLLSYIHKYLKTNLQVTVQLPIDTIFDKIALNFEKQNCQVIRDEDSKNKKELKKYYKLD